jgi:excisionase family DNA binding protein
LVIDPTPFIAEMTPDERAALAAELLAANVRDAVRDALAITAVVPEASRERSAPPVPDVPAVMGAEHAASYCGIGINHMRDLLRAGVIHARRSGRRWLVRREALDAWMLAEERAERERRERLLGSGRARGRGDLER